jgi:unsaturated chondroitin disaccharide hydrolase
MPLRIQNRLTARQLRPKVVRLFDLSADKILALEKSWEPARGAPVFTARGKYISRGWTDWTLGFQAGSALLQFDATGEKGFLDLGRGMTLERSVPHLTHTGVHDHGFNILSTFGNLWRLQREGRLPFLQAENQTYELALKVSGAVQAARWTPLAGGGGYIYSFNGPHSLFVDTLRSLRSLALAHQLGHVLVSEQDQRISLLERMLEHAHTTATYSIYYGKGRDAYDLAGRTAHESIFDPNTGAYRCPNSQQGFSPFSTWTRGLAWAILGFAEQLEFLATLPRSGPGGASAQTRSEFLKAAVLTADFYLGHCCSDGIPFWDTAAPNLHRLSDALDEPADPFNRWEPVDSSAAAIAAQGLLRLGNYLRAKQPPAAIRYRQAALTIAATLLAEPYLSLSPNHQGLLLHSVYHRPNGWDYLAPGQSIPNGESSMWGDYHLRELGLMLLREADGGPYAAFFGPDNES